LIRSLWKQQASLKLQVRKRRNLEAAWKAIQQNGHSSKSEEVRNEIATFEQDASGNLLSLARRLRSDAFKFPPARGVRLSKTNKKDWRPIVLASVEARIVQRAILQVLQEVDALQLYFRNPYSFGGIKRQKKKDGEVRYPEDELAAVPAAIHTVLGSIRNGGCFIVCADISSFFSHISKSAVTDVIASTVNDPEFMNLFQAAIRVELSNVIELRAHAQRFPTEDMGVAQGNSLSPLLGNIILHKFDQEMNEGDCRCLRYIDDFIIVAPTKKAAMARLRRARSILGRLRMSLSEDKTSAEAISVTEKFEFLGIEFNNGMIRPASKARTKFLDSIRTVCEESQKALRKYRHGHALDKSKALLDTLKRIDGAIHGWGKHYFFCRDEQFFSNLDNEIYKILSAYLGFYREERKSIDNEIRRRAMLGVESLSLLQRSPFEWVWSKTEEHTHSIVAAETLSSVATLLGEEAVTAGTF
jgi:RNA-directed DNA polymerase